MNHERAYWAQFKSSRHKHRLGPYPTREAAVAAALACGLKIKHKTLISGYGTGGAWFDIRWHDDETRPLIVERVRPRVKFNKDSEPPTTEEPKDNA